MPPLPPFTAKSFIASDNSRGLFPLDSTKLYASHGSQELESYIVDSILDENNRTAAFLTAPVCYALKDSVHTRKVLGLDPIATYFLYYFVNQHAKAHFQTTAPSDRQAFGYAFKNRRPVSSPTEKYHEFRRKSYELKARFRYFARVDIANCFNSFYHHDIDRYISDNISEGAAQQFGQFLREINSGTSVNCFPQGTYPAKAIGNRFLSFIEENVRLKCPAIIRFLDDVFLFSSNESVLRDDIYMLQEILGNHNLYLNPGKTVFGTLSEHTLAKKIDAIKRRLLEKREAKMSYDGSTEEEDEVDDEDENRLEPEERDYLEHLVDQPNVPEEDLELALSLVDDEDTVMKALGHVCTSNRHLMNHIYHLFGRVEFENDSSWELIRKRIYSNDAHEHELFWLAKIVSDYYDFDTVAAEALVQIYSHKNASDFVRAVVLENPNNGLGLLEIKEDQLRKSPADIAGAAALMGIRNLAKGRRNQIGKYAARSGQHVKVLADIVSKIDQSE
jgi:hypothetical protein